MGKFGNYQFYPNLQQKNPDFNFVPPPRKNFYQLRPHSPEEVGYGYATLYINTVQVLKGDYMV